MEEVVGKRAIAVTNRGNHEEIALVEPLNTLYAGNLADVCPVGALTSEDFRFKMRVWFLSRTGYDMPRVFQGMQHYGMAQGQKDLPVYAQAKRFGKPCLDVRHREVFI